MSFKKATKEQLKLKIALGGTSGSGKTYSALRLASGIGGKIAFIDTERHSANNYANDFDFDVVSPDDFSIDTYMKHLNEAVALGYNVCIIDSITHEFEWLKTYADRVGASSASPFGGWSKATPKHQQFLDAILNAPIHTIVTIRSKAEWVIEVNEKGKNAPKKLGTKLDQKEGIDYEFSTVFVCYQDGGEHFARVEKDRTNLFKEFNETITEQTGEKFLEWLSSGEKNPAITKASEEQIDEVFKMIEELNEQPDPSALESWFEKVCGSSEPKTWTVANVQKLKDQLKIKLDKQPKKPQAVGGTK